MPWDKTRYPPNWKDLRMQRLEIANNCCEHCGIPNGTPKPTRKNPNNKIVLTTAHLDHDSENWDITIDRLRSLCQGCHLKYDLHRHIQKRKYGKDVFKTQPDLFTNQPTTENE